VAKILVADDNSNVQKTVALALADLGVDVVSVNNGEAAVRMLPEVFPDLILADIFMPVRNGYEVCEFVKKDSRFSHVPVVLLVGAFDPLDEREAQRVGADGVLKKPFVPPDPLMTMVKTLLDRALGERLVAVGVSKAQAAVETKAGAEPPKPARAPAPAASPAPVAPPESPVEEFQPPANRVSFGEEERPVAFGKLLETPAQDVVAPRSRVPEPVEDDQVLTSSRDASLGEPIFWKSEEPEPDSEEASSEAEAEEDISSEISMRPWKMEEEVPTPAANTEVSQPADAFELVREENEEAAGQASTVVESTPLLAQDPASYAALTVEAGKLQDLAANPIEWMSTAPPVPVEEVPPAIPEWSGPATENREAPGSEARESSKALPEPIPPEPPAPAIDPVSFFTPVAPPLPQPPVQAQAEIPAQSPSAIKTHPSLKPLSQSPEETPRSIPKMDWTDLSASLESKRTEAVAEKQPEPIPVPLIPVIPVTPSVVAPTATLPAESIPLLPPPVAAAPAPPEQSVPIAPANPVSTGSPDPALVEAVVQRVLDKMRPQVVDIITKEFLRPVVQALVHREVQKR
jgi:CheY-like chemotaxis protein